VREVLPEVRRLTRLDRALVVSPQLVVPGGLDVERFDCDGFADGAELARLFAAFFAKAPPRYAWYNASAPEAWQRNRVIDAIDLMPPEELQTSTIYRDVLLPGGLAHCRQPRALLCEGPTLLGWFGAFHDDTPDTRARSLLARLLRPFHRRLATDRRLHEIGRQEAAMHAGLDALGCPAFCVDTRGTIREANAAGRALLQTRHGDVRRGLEAAARGGTDILQVELVDLGRGAGAWLALVRGTRDAQVSACLAAAQQRWVLSARQREILAHVVEGAANASIAQLLGVSLRAVEQHVTALLNKAGVGTRAALVAATLAPSENRSTSGVRAPRTGS